MSGLIDAVLVVVFDDGPINKPHGLNAALPRETHDVVTIFDCGRRLLWCTTFDGEWDAHVEDALVLIGVEHFLDWMRHTAQGVEILAGSAQLKAILRAAQTEAAAYFNPLGPLTLPQIITAHRMERAFQQVLDNPAAADALEHPALKPLLLQAGNGTALEHGDMHRTRLRSAP